MEKRNECKARANTARPDDGVRTTTGKSGNNSDFHWGTARLAMPQTRFSKRVLASVKIEACRPHTNEKAEYPRNAARNGNA
ncbi:hypothetical protein EON83_14305 [bacterium]|nr:MAG: hypothetical protein EON83_14305 [bacterium]